MYKPSTYLSSYLFSYLFIYIWDLFLMELVTKAKPKINSVEVHSVVTDIQWMVRWWLLVHCGPKPPVLWFWFIYLFIYFIYLLCRELELAVNLPFGNLRENWNTWFFKIQITAQHWYVQLMYKCTPSFMLSSYPTRWTPGIPHECVHLESRLLLFCCV